MPLGCINGKLRRQDLEDQDPGDLEPPQAATIMFGFLRVASESLQMVKVSLSILLVWGNIEDHQVEHGDQGKALVELRERQQDP